ncbi:MAG: hypothetical protein ACFFCY_06240 [Promethearchaeota archaeon]
MKLNTAGSHRTLLESVEVSEFLNRELEWRPATLFPEDLIAF